MSIMRVMNLLHSLVYILPALVAAKHTVLERKSDAVEREWQISARAPKHHTLDINIAMSSENRALMEQHALEIADPSSPRWRQHLTPSEISDMLRPSDAAVEAVMAWLKSVGVEGQQSHDMITAKVAVGQAETLLDTSYSLYEHSTGKRAIRTESYSVPEDLKRHIDFISPTVHFPEINHGNRLSKRALRKRLVPAPGPQTPEPPVEIQVQQTGGSHLIGPCGNGTFPHNTTTPECIRAAYSVDWNASNPNTSWAIFNVDGGKFNDTNLQKYLQLYNKPAAKAHATFELINYKGFNASGNSEPVDLENELDTQLSIGLAYPAKAIQYNTDTDGIYGNISNFVSPADQAKGQDLFLQFLHDMTYNKTVPPVVSFSAGNNEDFVPAKYAARACSMFAAAGARGVTFVFSSGDFGPVAQVRNQHNHTVVPTWPASCPWVLAVGATSNPFNETAATYNTAKFTSGGGFSNLFGRPAYQNGVVPPYIKNHVDVSFQKLSGFNASGRGYPDVAAFGYDVPIFSNGIVPEFGTSASAPLWAALITLLNDYEASKGKPTLGFLNPWLYSLKNGELRDITIGNGSDFATDRFLWIEPYPTVGYNGSVGWDALTGLGVPVFNKLRAALP